MAGAFPSTWAGRGWHVGREAAMAAPPPAHHSIMMPCFYGSPGFFHKHSRLQISSLLSPHAVSSHPAAVLSLGLLSNPHVPAPSPHVHWWTHVPGQGTQDCGMDCLCRSHSVLPAKDRPFHYPLTAPVAPFLSQLISLLVRGFPHMKEPLHSFSSPQGAQVPSHFSSSFSLLLSFILLCVLQIR